MPVPARYQHINFTPPSGVRDALRDAVAVQRGGVIVPLGVHRATSSRAPAVRRSRTELVCMPTMASTPRSSARSDS